MQLSVNEKEEEKQTEKDARTQDVKSIAALWKDKYTHEVEMFRILEVFSERDINKPEDIDSIVGTETTESADNKDIISVCVVWL